MTLNSKKIQKVIASICLSAAKTSAGLASEYGWYQRKIPKKLTEMGKKNQTKYCVQQEVMNNQSSNL